MEDFSSKPALVRNGFSRDQSGAFNEFLTREAGILITASSWLVAGWFREYVEFSQMANRMMDLIYIGVVVLFFVVGGWYVRACEKM